MKDKTKDENTEAEMDASKVIEKNLGKELMDLSLISDRIVDSIPSYSSEMFYRIELKTSNIIYGIFCFLGFLMFASVIISII